MRTIYIISCVLLFSFHSCKKNTDLRCENSPYTVLNNESFGEESKETKYENSYFIINEGGFTYGNGSISAYNPISNEIENQIFKNLNNFKLGDVVQSVKIKNQLSYIVVNNSQKIEIIQTNTFERLRTIIGFSSPRYIEFINEKDALISDLYENSIQVIDTENGCLLGKIKTNGWTEEIVKLGTNFWAIERNSIGEESKFANLIKINTLNYSIENRIEIPVEPNSLVIDNDENIWILSSGFESSNKLPKLIKFNSQTQNIEKNFSFTNFQNIAQNLTYSPSENSLYFNRTSDIYKMSTSDTNIVSNVFFSSAAQIIYGLDINTNTKELYISDAVDYVSNGKIFRYSSTGNLISEFEVGILPSKVIF